jgi:hypothetical protein
LELFLSSLELFLSSLELFLSSLELFLSPLELFFSSLELLFVGVAFGGFIRMAGTLPPEQVGDLGDHTPFSKHVASMMWEGLGKHENRHVIPTMFEHPEWRVSPGVAMTAGHRTDVLVQYISSPLHVPLDRHALKNPPTVSNPGSHVR